MVIGLINSFPFCSQICPQTFLYPTLFSRELHFPSMVGLAIEDTREVGEWEEEGSLSPLLPCFWWHLQQQLNLFWSSSSRHPLLWFWPHRLACLLQSTYLQCPSSPRGGSDFLLLLIYRLPHCPLIGLQAHLSPRNQFLISIPSIYET